ncbi:MAG: hypothetical protein V7K18_04335 [Nostoc sp.]|uniref:hypothetical protein n=1 Tax=Nostoc sp. TaxID=1180 RepID=UPI002FF736BD
MTRSTTINRRYFLMASGSALASIIFASCTPSQNSSTSQSASQVTSQPVSQSTKTALLKVGSRNNVSEDILKFLQK